jgi:hypothetical protein
LITLDKFETAIRDTQKQLDINPKHKTALDFKLLYESLDFSPREICIFQEKKSIAQLENKIDLETALKIYNLLNGYQSTSLAERIVLCGLFQLFLRS